MCVFGYLSLAHNTTHLCRRPPAKQALTPTYTKAHMTTHSAVMTVRGGEGESKQGQISSDSEGRQLHILISLHFRFSSIELLSYLWNVSSKHSFSASLCPSRPFPAFVTSQVHSIQIHISLSKGKTRNPDKGNLVAEEMHAVSCGDRALN